MQPADIQVNVTTIYGANSRQGIVCLQWGDRTPFQMQPEKAREIAMMLLAAAESAEQDAFIVEFFGKLTNYSDERVVAGLLQEFREWREKQRSEA